MTIINPETIVPTPDELPWTPSGLLCLELVLAEVENNGKYIYARENLSQVSFEQFTREVHNWGDSKKN